MIDRKALWISLIIIVAMLGALVWRLSLLPDWHQMPLDGPGSSHTANSLILFSQPLALALMTAVMYGRKWFAAGSEEALRSWGRWSTRFVIAFCVLVGLGQAVMLARSLGYGLAVDRIVISRILIAATGLMMMAVGNALPKLPWLSMRLRLFHLDPWQQKRHLRFQGRLLVGMGFYILLIALALPLVRQLPKGMALPVMMGPCLLLVAVSLWHRARLKREPSSLAENPGEAA